MKRRAVLAALWLAAAGGSVPARAADAAKQIDVKELIRRLGDDHWKVREEATRRLAELGEAALPALRKAMDSDDLEVSLRAKMIYDRGAELLRQRVRAERQKMHEAFAAADYATMIQLAQRLAASPEAELLDRLWLGHAHQLAGNIPEAVAAYRSFADQLADELTRKDAAVPMVSLRQRTSAMLLIARLQRHELKDAKAAAGSCAEALQPLGEPADRELARLRFFLLKELAECQEEAGQYAEALATWRRIEQSGGRYLQPGKGRKGYDDAAVTRLLGKLGQRRPAADLPGVSVLTPETPQATFEPARQAGEDGWWKRVLLPPRGKEFQTVQFACDFEQHTDKTPAHMYCSTLPHDKDAPEVPLGGVSWPRGAKPGRKTCEATFRLPAGSGALRIQAATGRNSTLHRVVAAATFRSRQDPDPQFQPGTRLRVELLPAGGKLACDGDWLDPNPSVIHGRIKPGRHVFEYVVPGRSEGFKAAVEMVPGGQYALFANLDSPFRSTWTNLRGIGDVSWWMACRACLAQLPDGRWLLASCGTDQKVRLAESKDLVTWSPPRELPLDSVSHNQAPCLHAAADGTVHLAWFSDRLSVEADPNSRLGRHRLWIARSPDGRTWSRPRPIALVASAKWPVDPVQVVVAPNQRVWMFWRNQGASAGSLEKIRALEPLGVPNTLVDQVDTAHVSFDPQGRMHMLFDMHTSIYYSRSADGGTWSEPICLVPKPRAKAVRRGQLIFGQRGACLIYEHDDGAFLRPVTVGETLAMGRDVQITGKLAPLNGMRACRTKDDQLVLLAGADTVAVLRAKLEDLPEKP
jgi:hypothetical protein